MFSKLILFEFNLLVLCLIAFVVSGEELPHNCSRNQFDEDLSQVIGLFGVKGIDFPTNEKEMKKFCSFARKGEELSNSFRDRCLKGYPKTVMYTFSKSLQSFLNQFCGESPPERQNFIEWSKCGNKGKTMGTTKCWNRLLTNLHKTKHMEDPEDRVPAMCWTCTLNTLRTVEECDEDIIENYDIQIKKISMDPLLVLCDEYFEEPFMCVPIFELMPEFDPSQRRRVNTKTPLLGIFKIFESLH